MAVTAPAEVFYPSSDGKPVAETDIHIQWFVILRGRLKRFFAKKKVYVAGNMLVYFMEGQPKKCFAPDAFVVKNCQPKIRRIFKIWEEGRVPCWVMEITSASTRLEDIRTKFEIYKRLGIKEYFLYDPLGDWLKPRLIGYRLVRGEYEKIDPQDDAILSRELGILFSLDGAELVMKSAATGELVLSNEEITQIAEQRAEEEHQRAEEERVRADSAEDRLAQLTAEMERLRQELSRKPNGKAKP